MLTLLLCLETVGRGLKLEVANDGAASTARWRPSQLTVTVPTAVRRVVWVAAAAAGAATTATTAAATFSEKILAPNEEGRGREREGGRNASRGTLALAVTGTERALNAERRLARRTAVRIDDTKEG